MRYRLIIKEVRPETAMGFTTRERMWCGVGRTAAEMTKARVNSTSLFVSFAWFDFRDSIRSGCGVQGGL